MPFLTEDELRDVYHIEDKKVLAIWNAFLDEENLENRGPNEAILWLEVEHEIRRKKPAERQFSTYNWNDEFGGCCPPRLSRKTEFQKALYLKLLNLQILFVGEQARAILHRYTIQALTNAIERRAKYDGIIDLAKNIRNFRWGDDSRMVLSTAGTIMSMIILSLNYNETTNYTAKTLGLFALVFLLFATWKRAGAIDRKEEIADAYTDLGRAVLQAPPPRLVFVGQGRRLSRDPLVRKSKSAVQVGEAKEDRSAEVAISVDVLNLEEPLLPNAERQRPQIRCAIL